jgi:hypothetical protein
VAEQAGKGALEKLSEKLLESAFRRKLASGAAADVLKQEGIDPTALPSSFVEGLSMLSERELNVIATLNLKLKPQIKPVDVSGGILF